MFRLARVCLEIHLCCHTLKLPGQIPEPAKMSTKISSVATRTITRDQLLAGGVLGADANFGVFFFALNALLVQTARVSLSLW